MLAFATSFAMVGVCTAAAYAGGSNALTVVLLRTLGTVLLLALYMRVSAVSFRLDARTLRIAWLLGIPLALNNYLINAAIEQIPVPLAVLIFYLWPALTTAGSWLLGRDRPRARSLAGLALAFAGVGLAVNVDFTAAQAKGVWLAGAASVVWSAVFLLNNHFFHGRDTRPTTFYMAMSAAALFILASAITRDVSLPAGMTGWAGILGVPFFYAFAMIGLFAATATIGPMRTGFYMNFEPIAAVVLGALLLRQMLAPVQLAGAALVIVALVMFRPPVAR